MRARLDRDPHRTRGRKVCSDRYHIVSERRLEENAAKLAAHLKAKERRTLTDSQLSQAEVL
jgi:hypothetical protein